MGVTNGGSRSREFNKRRYDNDGCQKEKDDMIIVKYQNVDNLPIKPTNSKPKVRKIFEFSAIHTNI